MTVRMTRNWFSVPDAGASLKVFPPKAEPHDRI